MGEGKLGHLRRLLKRYRVWIIFIVIIAIAGGVYAFTSKGQAKVTPTYTTGVVKRGDIANVISATGTINPVHYVDVSTNVGSKLETVDVKENQQVTEGQVIATIDPRQLQATVDDAKAKLDNTKRDLDRYSQLSEEGAIPKQTYDNALMAYQQAQAAYDKAVANLSDTTITAPMTGTIIGTPLKAGQTISTGISTQMIIATIADLSDLEIYLTVDETDISHVKAGERVTFTVDAHPGKTYTGYVTQIAKGTKGNLGTTSTSVVYYTVHVSIPKADASQFFPMMTARANIYGQEQRNVLVVPLAAVRTDKQGEYVYVIKDGKPVRTSVTTGTTGDTNIQIVKGLTEGQEIVVSGDVSPTSGSKSGGGRMPI